MSEFSESEQNDQDQNISTINQSSHSLIVRVINLMQKDTVQRHGTSYVIIIILGHTQEKILEYFYQGVINEYSLIWKDSFDDWFPVKKVDEI